MPTTVTILVENTAKGQGTLGEHGLAYWVDADGYRVLFDTGQSGSVLIHNATRLGIDIAGADAVVLSHGHYDHTGGLPALLDLLPPHVPVHLHPAALEPKYHRRDDQSIPEIGMPSQARSALLARPERMRMTRQVTQVGEALRATGQVPRRTDYEDVGGAFYLDALAAQPDPILDDQAVFFDCERGTVVLLGCAHAGVVNTLEHVLAQTGGRHIHACIGGMHLLKADETRMRRTLAAFERFAPDWIAPMHCTGFAQVVALAGAFGDRCVPSPVGTCHVFE